MTQVLIYKPSRHPMQSGLAGMPDHWILEFRIDSARTPNALTGWAASYDTNHQKRLKFETKEEAVRFAEKHALDYMLRDVHERKVKPRNYLDNFKKSAITDK